MAMADFIYPCFDVFYDLSADRPRVLAFKKASRPFILNLIEHFDSDVTIVKNFDWVIFKFY